MSKSGKPAYKRWDKREDEKLKYLVNSFGSDWMKIAASLSGRTESQCRHRWEHVLNPQRRTGLWSQEEDQKLTDLVRQNGPVKWSEIAKEIEGRSGKQCRERWHNHLNPNLNKAPWTTEEENIIIQAQKQYGNQWAKIARLLKGRSDNGIKNHFNSTLKKRVETSVPAVPPVNIPVSSCQPADSMVFDAIGLDTEQHFVPQLAYPVPTHSSSLGSSSSVLEDIENSLPPLEEIAVDEVEGTFDSPSSSNAANQPFSPLNVFLDNASPSIENAIEPIRALAPIHNQQKRPLIEKTDPKRLKMFHNFQSLPNTGDRVIGDKKISSLMPEIGCENIMWDVSSVLSTISPQEMHMQQQVPDILSFPAVTAATNVCNAPSVNGNATPMGNYNDFMHWRELDNLFAFNETEVLSRFPTRKWDGRDIPNKENVCPNVNVDLLEPSILHLMSSDCLNEAEHFYV